MGTAFKRDSWILSEGIFIIHFIWRDYRMDSCKSFKLCLSSLSVRAILVDPCTWALKKGLKLFITLLSLCCVIFSFCPVLLPSGSYTFPGKPFCRKSHAKDSLYQALLWEVYFKSQGLYDCITGHEGLNWSCDFLRLCMWSGLHYFFPFLYCHM